MKKNSLLLLAGLGILIPLASFAISDPTSFSLVSSGSDVQLLWTNPVTDFDYTTIRRSSSSYPTSIVDGDLVATGTFGDYLDTGLGDGTYYYTLFASDLSGNVSTGATGYAIIDTTDPVITAYSPSGSVVSGIVYFTRDMEDEHINGSSIQLLISGDPNIYGLAYQNTIFPTDTGTVQTLTQIVGGLRDQVRYRSSIIIDGYGNQTTTPPTMFEVDGTGPTITYTSPIADGGSILSGESAILSSETYDLHLSGGHIHTLIGTAVNFDQTRPTNGLYHGGNAPLDTTGIGSLTITNLPVGTYYRYTEANDVLGNYTSGAMQSFTVVESRHRSGGGAGGAATNKVADTCTAADLSPSDYDGLCFDSNGTPVSHREKILKLLNPNATPSDTGNYVTVAGFIRDVFALLDIPFYGTMPESYTNTPVSEKLFAKVVKKLGVLLQ